MSESTPFSRQRLPAPTEPLADRVAAVLAECDAARVRERARRDRIAAVEARPVPPAVTPELRAARARVRETRAALDRALAAESDSESEPARPPQKPSAARKPSAKPASKPAARRRAAADAPPFDPLAAPVRAKSAKQRRAIADSSDDDEAPAPAPAKPAKQRRTIVESDSDDAPAPPPRPATARPATISQDDAPRPAARKPAAAGDAPPAMKKQSGYLHHNAQNRELARAMVESDPATAGLGAQERNQAVMKKLAAMWGELDAAQKQAFADDAPLVAVKPRKAKKGAAKPAARANPAGGPVDEARRLAADPSIDLREAYRREQASRAPAVAAPAVDEDSDDSDDAPLESLITVRRRDDSSDDD